MSDIKARRRASKLMELTGDRFYDPTSDKYINSGNRHALEFVIQNAAKSDGRLNPDRLNRDSLEENLGKWENTPQLVRMLLTGVIKNKLKAQFLPAALTGVDELIPALDSQLNNPGWGDPTKAFLQGVKRRVPQIPQRVPELINQINQPSDIDRLGDLRQYLIGNQSR